MFGALRTMWWLPIAGAVLGAGVALAASLLTTPLYEARTQFFVSTSGAITTTDAFQGNQLSQQRVASYVELLRSEELASRVIDRLGLDVSPDELVEDVEPQASTNTVLIDVTVTATSPEGALELADALGAEFISFVDALEAPSADTGSSVRVTVADPPEAPREPSRPRTMWNVAAGALAGLLLFAASAVLRVRFDGRLRDAEQAEAAAGAPVIGTVIRDERLADRHVFDSGAPSRAAEGYRHLRTNLEFLNVADPPRVVMVSSAMPAEGRTTTVINLALALAEAGREVTVVDADLRRPDVARRLGLGEEAGLTDVLAGVADLADVVRPYGDSGVRVVGAGLVPPNPSGLVSSKRMRQLIADLRESSDFVLIDAPPLLPVADAAGLAVMVDGVLLSARHASTRTEDLRQAAAALDRVGARGLGVVLTMVPAKARATAAYDRGNPRSREDRAGEPRHRS